MTIRQLSVGGETITYQIRAGSERRRRLAIRVTTAGQVEVLLPPGDHCGRADEAVRMRADWILRHVRRMSALPQATPPAYVSGEEHLWQGTPLRLDVLPSRSWQGVTLADNRLVVSVRDGSPVAVRRLLDHWYRDEARRILGQRLHDLAASIVWLPHVPPWQLKNLRRRWGSCNARGELTLNVRLVKTPPVCMDYVILHEIAHLRELNHSPAFYAELSQLMPEWQTCRKLLNSFARRVLV